MSKYTKKDILEMVEDEDVEFIRLQFTDLFGNMKNLAITSSHLKNALDNKVMFDGSSVEGFVRVEESDMYLYPDYSTFATFPWKPGPDPGPQGFPDGLSLQRGRLHPQSQLQPLPEPPKRMSNSRIQI